MADIFACPTCGETYQSHWRASDFPELCRTCAAAAAGACVFADHPQHLDRHPCSYGGEEPGDPCRYCGDPIAADENGRTLPCPRCWIPIPDNLADAKALLALGGFSLNLPSTGEEKTDGN